MINLLVTINRQFICFSAVAAANGADGFEQYPKSNHPSWCDECGNLNCHDWVVYSSVINAPNKTIIIVRLIFTIYGVE
jgi:hypothetical protein